MKVAKPSKEADARFIDLVVKCHNRGWYIKHEVENGVPTFHYEAKSGAIFHSTPASDLETMTADQVFKSVVDAYKRFNRI